MDYRSESLGTLRRVVSETRTRGELEAICDALEADPRAGARALAGQTRRRIQRFDDERARLARLFERRAQLHARGVRLVAGVDEVGVGPLAGPVVAAAVVLNDEVHLPGLDDSKKLTARKREALDVAIREQARGIGLGVVESTEIDELNILRATLLAMQRAVESVDAEMRLDHLLVDARVVPGTRLSSAQQTPIIHGDALDGSIAAASIVAKVYRDAMMMRFDDTYPQYGFRRHMGYGTPEHLAALRAHGPTPIHRRSFAPVAAACR